MKYFVFDNQRSGTCYHEFFKGKWDKKTFWKKDSICLSDDFLTKDLYDALIAVIPSYDPYGETEISYEEWEQIGIEILSKDKQTQEIYFEANQWLNNVFKQYSCFTILGI